MGIEQPTRPAVGAERPPDAAPGTYGRPSTERCGAGV
jgi:hypothetical protein